jgi:hypothetical protein
MRVRAGPTTRETRLHAGEQNPEAPAVRARIVSSVPFILAALGVLLVLIGLALPAAGRIDLSRTVLVRAPVGTTWELVRRVPALLARHGKVREHGGIDDWSLERGDGAAAGSIWRGRGRWGSGDYWVDVEVVRCDVQQEIAIRLVRDSLGTHRGLRDHLGSMRLEPIAPAATKLTWRLRARRLGPRLRLARIVSPGLLRARLLDQGLRSIKVAIEASLEGSDAEAPRATAPPPGPGIGAAPSPPAPPRPPDAIA